MIHRRAAHVLFSALFSLFLAAGTADAQSITFAGKRITIFCGFSPGGVGYDTYSRTLARYLGRYLPGNPVVVVEDRPGAGSMSLANYLYNVAPHDGTEIGMIGRGIATDKLITGSASSAKYDAPKFGWLGSMNNEVSGFYLREGAAASGLSELLAGKTIPVGSSGPGGDQDVFSRTLNNLLGMKLRIVVGYPGTTEMVLAMMRGELDGLAGLSWTAAKVDYPEELQTGKIKIILQFALQKAPDLPDVPLVMDLIKDPAQKQAMELIFSRQSMGRPIVAPPGVDPQILHIYRNALAEVVRDPDFLAETKQIGLEVNYVSGEDVQALVEKMFTLPPAIVAAVQRAAAATSP